MAFTPFPAVVPPEAITDQPLKVTPVGADELLIADSEAGAAAKKILLSTLLGGGFAENTVAGNVIDMNATVNTHSISADELYTFSNLTVGNISFLVVENTDVSPHSVSFVGAGLDPLQGAVAVGAGTKSVYSIQASSVGGSLGPYVQLLSSSSTGSFPLGTDGALTILNGQTVQLEAGDIKDYTNIDIQTGGVLELLDTLNTGDPVEIYATGTFNLDGEIRGRDTELGTFNKSGNFANSVPYNLTISQNAGGDGGNGATGWGGSGAGGASANGYAGGGGGAGCRGDAAYGYGGVGGTNNGNGAVGTSSTAGTGMVAGLGDTTQVAGDNGTNGASNFGGTGGNGGGSGAGGGGSAIDTFGGTGFCGGGGGGGGGMKGLHGSLLYMFCTSIVTGTGIVNLSGTDAYVGGNGGDGFRSGSSANIAGGGAGGGGGGAGGSGGHLQLLVGGYSFSTDVTGGSGSLGGTAGIGIGTNGNTGKEDGFAGSGGNAGSVVSL